MLRPVLQLLPGLVAATMKRSALAVLALFVLGVVSARGQGCPPRYAQDFDQVTPPVLPTDWTATQGMNVTGAPLWVTSTITPDTAPNDVFSTAPDNILDNRLDAPPIFSGIWDNSVTFRHSYNLEEGFDGAVLEISTPSINGGAFTDVTDPAVGGSFAGGGGYNTIISAGSQSPIAGRMAWSGNSNGYVSVQLFLGFIDQNFFDHVVLRFRLATDNSGASAGWRVDTFRWHHNECPPPPSPSATATPTPPTPTPTASPCTVIDGSLAPGDTTQGNRVTQQYPGGTCAAPYTCPGPWVAGTYRFDEHHFTNTSGAPQCINIAVTAPGLAAGDLWCMAYSPTYDPANVCLNFLGQGGQHYSVTVPAGQTFSVIITDMHSVEERTFPYTLYVGSCSVPTPTPTPPPTPTPYPTITPTPPPSQALNISTRLRVETGDRVMIGGFIITGSAPKKVAIRAVGPSLSNLGLSDVLADPTLELRGSDGVLLMQNDNWQDDPAQAAQLTALGLALEDPNESGIVATLPPGAYTAIMAGKNQTTGIGLVELYDAEVAAASQLANISTRGFVRTADNVMIGGFILGGSNAGASVAIRGIGPSLSQAGLSNVLADPTVELHDGNGALLISNDDWQDDPASAEQLTAYGLAPTDAKESAIFAPLPPGAFTAILAGKDGGVGLGLLEIYGDVHGETLTVTSTADSGPGSLRGTIATASSGDTIQFDATLNGQTIGLTSGELVIGKNITISGIGPDFLAVSRVSGTFRIFHILPGHAVVIEGVRITGGFSYGDGGGVFNEQATLTLKDCEVEGNYSGGAGGGGIYSSGESAILTILNSTVNGNLNSGIYSGTGGEGAGINSAGTLTIANSSVSGNSVTNQPPRPGRTGGIFSNGTLEITNSTIVGNIGGVGGGGITASGGPIIITNSTISQNTVIGYGGGIYCSGSSTTITNSTVSGNSASYKDGGFGGGILNSGPLKIINSTISGNFADRSGGIFSGGNDAVLEISNSTFSGNRADAEGGGISNAGTMQIENTILNAGTSGPNIYSSGMVTSHGYNLSSDNGGGFLTGPGDQINTNPILGSLLYHGGPTPTHALLTGSPAIDAGDPNFTPPPLYDQRGLGYDRVVNGRIDIGSFELQP